MQEDHHPDKHDHTKHSFSSEPLHLNPTADVSLAIKCILSMNLHVCCVLGFFLFKNFSICKVGFIREEKSELTGALYDDSLESAV